MEAVASIHRILEPAAVGFFTLDPLTRRRTLAGSRGSSHLLAPAIEKWLDGERPAPAAVDGATLIVPLQDGHGCDFLVAVWTGRQAPGAAEGFTSAIGNIVALGLRRRRAEEALRQREKLSSLGSLVAGVAHEINNPLSFVQSNVELARMSLSDCVDSGMAEADARELFGRMISQLDAALKGVEQVATISRGLKRVARSSRHERHDADVNELVGTALLIASTRIPLGARVEVDLGSTQLVRVDANSISQVLLNLLLNAGDALTSSDAPVLGVRTRDEGRFCVVEVADNGPGISEALRGSIFTPFVTSKPHGTGLGLSISQRIVREHGGRISFETCAERGTTFRLELPVAHVLPSSPADGAAGRCLQDHEARADPAGT